MRQPTLLDVQRMGRRLTPEKFRYDCIVKFFGELSEAAEWPPAAPALAAAARFDPARHAEWQRAIAEELLLRRSWGHAVPDDWRVALAHVSPTDDGMPLSGRLDSPAACAVFPLATRTPRPGAGHVWRFADETTAFVTTEPAWRGESWQLAGALADLALQSRDSTAIRALATRWIATGMCDGDRIGPVEIGNKLALASGRDWLLPASLMPPDETAGGRIYRAASVRSAFAIVAGRGFQRVEDQWVPQPVDVMHSFVSEARLPLLLAALALRPARIVLWYSEKYKHTAAGLAERILPAFLPDSRIAALLPIASSDPTAVDQTLRRALRDDACRYKSVVFSITNGNLLQRLAASGIATAIPDVLLVYRDVDTSGTNLTTLSYQTHPPTACFNATARIAPEDVNIAALTSREDKGLTDEELIFRLRPEKMAGPMLNG